MSMKSQIEAAIAAIVQELYSIELSTSLTRPEEAFGDYATNVSMQLAGRLSRPPKEIAAELAAALNERLEPLITEATIAGPGFINISLKDSALIKNLDAEGATIWKDKLVLVEYSDPNPFK